ncbi:hypothetical protein MTR67_031841 [Solanum verrucosum]|uniref:Uncharacterized protein n=1 Tax=Solanum verrucosum TaxID=315347 RepID=A0AAF0U3C6_SOLVR|nr:hypothetical protein MTR67_031841 [Solanum verrucosum]
MKLSKDDGITILYHLNKTNMIDDALSRKFESMGSVTCLEVVSRPLARKVQSWANSLMKLELSDFGGVLGCIEAMCSFLDQIKAR